jgi:hypothetical protein
MFYFPSTCIFQVILLSSCASSLAKLFHLKLCTISLWAFCFHVILSYIFHCGYFMLLGILDLSVP